LPACCSSRAIRPPRGGSCRAPRSFSPTRRRFSWSWAALWRPSGSRRPPKTRIATRSSWRPASPGRVTRSALLARRGREEEARREIALYQQAFERSQQERFEKGARRAEITLGWTDLSSGKSEEALAQFERHPNDHEALRGKAAALSRLGRHAEAVAALERALSISPEDPRTRYALAREREKAKVP